MSNRTAEYRKVLKLTPKDRCWDGHTPVTSDLGWWANCGPVMTELPLTASRSSGDNLPYFVPTNDPSAYCTDEPRHQLHLLQ